jgi:viologen exporter family transport system permease protein
LITALWIGIGLLAFWLGDVGPVSWVWQKLMFVFGGLLMPIDLYPALVRGVAPFTPFPSVLSRPASLVLHENAGEVAALVLSLAAWGTVTAVALAFLFRRAAGALTVNGG